MAGIVFKAYHFTRNDAGEIISVEELPITVTQYGLIIMCDSFSPFEIVALDANMVKEKPDTGKTVMILADEGGDILLSSGKAAAGANGIVTLSKGQRVTLRVRPNAGKIIDAVTLDGRELSVSSSGTVTIAYEDIESSACFLSASFLSAAVRQTDENAGMTPVVPDTSKPGDPNDTSDPIPATGTAYASTQMVEIDGKKVEFQMYALRNANGDDTNYIKVRDLALALNGTKSQFSVDWDGTVQLTTGKFYAKIGTENSTPFRGNRTYTVPSDPTYINGRASDLAAIVLTDDNGGDYTYYKLRDLGRRLGFNVAWDDDRGVIVETGRPYTGK